MSSNVADGYLHTLIRLSTKTASTEIEVRGPFLAQFEGSTAQSMLRVQRFHCIKMKYSGRDISTEVHLAQSFDEMMEWATNVSDEEDEAMFVNGVYVPHFSVRGEQPKGLVPDSKYYRVANRLARALFNATT